MKTSNHYTAKFDRKDELLSFNRREKAVIALIDPEDDPVEDARSQGSWNKAINGKPSPDELVDMLEDLVSAQSKRPLQYMPDAPTDDLQACMLDIAAIPWWAEATGIDAVKLRSWQNGRGKKIDAVVREAVHDWYARLMDAAKQTEELTALGDAGGTKADFLKWARRRVEDGQEITVELIERMTCAMFAHPEIIDWQHPKCGYDDLDKERERSFFDQHVMWFQEYLDEARANDWEGVQSSFPPDDIWEYEEIFDKQWPGPYDDPHRLNEDLYYRHYKARTVIAWDRNRPGYDVKSWEVVEVEGCAPTEREKRGWDEGTQFFWKELRELKRQELDAYYGR